MADDDRTPPTPTRERSGVSTAMAGMAAAVATLAILHPVLEALGRHPEFFVARAAPRIDALVVAAVLGVVLPGALWSVVALLGRASPVVAGVVGGAVVAAGGASFALQALPGLPVPALLAGTAAGGALAVAVVRAPGSWAVVRWGVGVPVLSLAFFLVGLPVARVVWGGPELVAPVSAAEDPVPVAFVLFDELPTATLMEGPDRIDADRFPNFAAFADDAVWYRNATTVTDHTSAALPAMLTGQRPRSGTLPIAADHPQSLFTLLADTHEVEAVEPVTALCPAQVCGRDQDPAGAEDEDQPATSSAPVGLGALVDDVRLVGLHVLLPPAWTQGLPPVDQTWGAFGDTDDEGVEATIVGEEAHGDGAHTDPFDLWERVDTSSAGDRSLDFRGVIEAPAGRPPAYVLHTMLPHVPYRFLPTGQATTPVLLAGLQDGTWSDDAWLRDHAHRQHLLQAGLVDRMLGEVLDDLRAAGLYDEAMIVVAADHGVAFREGHHRREVDRATLPDIAAVPMFVHYPDGPRGQVDERPVETVDLVPTVVDLLGIEAADPLDGVSLLDPAERPSTRTVHSLQEEFTFEPAEADPWLVGAHVQERFGGDWEELYASVDNGELIGRDVAQMEVEAATNLVVVDHRARLRGATPSSTPIVGVLSGGLGFHQLPDGHVHVAVAFDGVIVAVGRTIEEGDDTAAFHALLDPSWYANEVDPIEVYRILDDGRLRGPLHDPDG